MTQGIILAAGLGRRMRGATGGLPKSLMSVKGTPLIERNIERMLEADFERVVVVTGYRADAFAYLPEKFGGIVELAYNPLFETSNTVSSLYTVKDMLDRDSYITTADLFLAGNPYLKYCDDKCFYLLRPEHQYMKPDWIAELDDNGRFLSVDTRGLSGYSYTGISHWTADGSRYIRGLLNAVDLGDSVQAKQYWDELLLTRFGEFDLRSMILRSDDEIYEFDDLGDIEAFEAEEGLKVDY